MKLYLFSINISNLRTCSAFAKRTNLLRYENVNLNVNVELTCNEIRFDAAGSLSSRTRTLRWVSKTQNGYIFTIFFYISNEIFYSNSLPYTRYIFDKYFVKFLLKFFENSVIGTSSPVTLQKKVLSA